MPINFTATKLIKLGDRPVSLGGGVRYWAGSPDGGPEGLGCACHSNVSISDWRMMPAWT